MAFDIRVVSNTPLTGEDDLDVVTRKFLEQIGYLSKGSDPKIPYRLFRDFFLKNPEKPWAVDELAIRLNASKPTVYRHLNKLKALDLLEETRIGEEGNDQNKKAYRIRYGNIEKAWNFVEAHMKVAIDNYSKTVEHMQNLLNKKE